VLKTGKLSQVSFNTGPRIKTTNLNLNSKNKVNSLVEESSLFTIWIDLTMESSSALVSGVIVTACH
jgi:hypothetical protein